MPPDFGKIEGTPKSEASHKNVGCPSKSLVAVTTALEFLM